MRICRYNNDRLGLVLGDEVADVTAALRAIPESRWPLPAGDPIIKYFGELRPEIERIARDAKRVPIANVRLDSPLTSVSKVIAAPVNYHKHLAEARADVGVNFGSEIKTIDYYGLFLKSSSSIVGPSDGILLPDAVRRIDHEVEVVVVIGRECFRVSEAEALDHVFGYCIGLDMSVRGTEDRSWRKSYDTFTVLGPHLVTKDEVADPGNIDFWVEVNGSRRQASNTSALIFSIPKLIAYASSAYRLYPGDIIMTGTPEGVGPVVDGDTLSAFAAGLGQMTVPVRNL